MNFTEHTNCRGDWTYGGGLKDLPVTAIQVFRVELLEFAIRNAWLRVFETSSRTTQALAWNRRPAPISFPSSAEEGNENAQSPELQ